MSKRPRKKAAVAPVDSRRWYERRPLLFLGAITVAALLPFVGKAFTMDDPLFVRTAQQIVQHPFDPYGFSINWYGRTEPMSGVTQNPPLTSYALAMASAITGWNEIGLHLAFLAFAFAVIAGTWSLARDMTERPFLAAVITLVTPFFLVSATNVMSDVPMLACFVWALALWRRGIDDDRSALLVIAALLAAAAGLFKYFGVSALPLMLVYAIVRKRRIGAWILPLALPLAAFAAYDFATKSMYGRALLTGAAHYATAEKTGSAANLVARSILTLGFAGGGAIAILFFSPLIARRRWWIAIAIVIGAALVVFATGAPATLRIAGSSAQVAHLVIFTAAGLGIVVLAVVDVVRHRSADSIVLFLWIAGTLIFAAYVNWTVNARSLLPLAPAVAILVSRHVVASRKAIAAAVAASAAVALIAAAADAAYANAQRHAATQFAIEYSGENHHIWFEGHWGFQYYMESIGAVPFGFDETLHGKDLLVTPSMNTLLLNDVQRPPHRVINVIRVPSPIPAGTVSNVMKAGFYSDYMGPLPYVFGAPPVETYTVRRLGR